MATVRLYPGALRSPRRPSKQPVTCHNFDQIVTLRSGHRSPSCKLRRQTSNRHLLLLVQQQVAVQAGAACYSTRITWPATAYDLKDNCPGEAALHRIHDGSRHLVRGRGSRSSRAGRLGGLLVCSNVNWQVSSA